MTNEPPEPQPSTAPHKLLWVAFWFVFLLTPAALISMPTLFKHFPRLYLLSDYGVVEAVSTLLAGSFAAAVLLARMRSTTRSQFIVRTLVFTGAFVILHGAISFAGCMSGSRS